MIRTASILAILTFAMTGLATTAAPAFAGDGQGAYDLAALDKDAGSWQQDPVVDNNSDGALAVAVPGLYYPYMNQLWWVRGPRYGDASNPQPQAAVNTASVQTMSRASVQPAVAQPAVVQPTAVRPVVTQSAVAQPEAATRTYAMSNPGPQRDVSAAAPARERPQR